MADEWVWRRVEIGLNFEVQYVAEKHGIRIEQARKLIARFGNDRKVLERAARLVQACPASQNPPEAGEGSPACLEI